VTVVGLDFGEGSLELAYELDGAPALLMDSARPSDSRFQPIVALEERVAWVGHAARDRLADLPRVKCIGGIKRSLGQSGIVHVDADGREWQAQGLAALPLRKLHADFISLGFAKTASAVAAVPAFADAAYRRGLMQACRLAGFDAVATVGTPVAIASIANSTVDHLVVVEAGMGRPTASLVELGTAPAVLDSLSGPLGLRERAAACLPPAFRSPLAAEDGAHELTDATERSDSIWEALHSSRRAARGYWRTREGYYPFTITEAFLHDAISAIASELGVLIHALLARDEARARSVNRIVCAGGWGRNSSVVRALERELQSAGIDMRITAAPAGSVAKGALQWHLGGNSPLLSVAQRTVGLRTRSADGSDHIEPLVAAGTRLPAAVTFPLFTSRTGQKRFLFELATAGDAGSAESLGVFAMNYDEDLPTNHRIDCSLTAARDGSMTLAVIDTRRGKSIHAVIGAADIDDDAAFARQRVLAHQVGINDAHAG
jgi:molecular chaperone DnaK (HSP70)